MQENKGRIRISIPGDRSRQYLSANVWYARKIFLTHPCILGRKIPALFLSVAKLILYRCPCGISVAKNETARSQRRSQATLLYTGSPPRPRHRDQRCPGRPAHPISPIRSPPTAIAKIRARPTATSGAWADLRTRAAPIESH